MVKRALTLLTSILIALPLLMPFNIFANSEIQIVPTWSQSAQQTQWANKFSVTNFCESSNNPQNYSCQLTITVNGDYYGYVYFDGYINNQIIFDYQTMFISGGKGTFYYTWYQNGLKEINKVNIAGLSLISPTDNIDLTQIIDLLTSINSYNQQAVGNQSTQIQQLQTVINDLIISNGYLETITKLRQWNIPLESFGFVNSFLIRNVDIVEIVSNNYFNYPIFNYELNDVIDLNNSVGGDYVMVMAIDRNITNISSFTNAFSFNKEVTVKSVEVLYYQSFIPRSNTTVFKAVINIPTSGFLQMTNIYGDFKVIPIYWNISTNKNVSTDFALEYALSNRLLDYLDVIANGTAQSSSAAQSSDSANDQLRTDSNTLFTQEDNFKSDMNNAMQNVNTTFRLQDMGTKFVSSAQWVRTQYENLTNNTPFASLITFSLITGLALILLGKVYK